MADARAKPLTELIERLKVPPDKKVTVSKDYDPGFKAGWLKKTDCQEHLNLTVEMLAEYQARLAAEERHGLLVVLQGIDAAGKDGTIRHVMSGVNPQGVSVHSFKVPSAEELSHDFLWRYGRRVPARGQIAIFNRSHYEEVLVVRVHPELLEPQRLPSAMRLGDLWNRRAWSPCSLSRRSISERIAPGATPKSISTRAATPSFSWASPTSRCSVRMSRSAARAANSMTRVARGVNGTWPRGGASPTRTILTTSALTRSSSSPCDLSARAARPSPSRSSPRSRCSVPM